jgi:hypothetical protein
MKALSLTQPWAQLVAIGAKKVETRGWQTAYRGWLAIHATISVPPAARKLCLTEPFGNALTAGGIPGAVWTDGQVRGADHRALPLGAIVAVANLHRCGEIRRTPDGQVIVHGQGLPITDERELVFGDYTPGRYGWVLTNVQPLREPIPCRGALGLWDVPSEVLAKIREQVEV